MFLKFADETQLQRVIKMASFRRSMSSYINDAEHLHLNSMAKILMLTDLKSSNDLCKYIDNSSHDSNKQSIAGKLIIAHNMPVVYMRNPDHLFSVYRGYNPLYATDGNGGLILCMMWEQLCDILKKVLTEIDCPQKFVSSVLFELKLRNSHLFEKGEIVFSHYPNINWNEVSNAAIVCFSDWPEKECAESMQSLFLGRYLGDETALFIQILNPE